MMDEHRIWCSFAGCGQSTSQPYADGWSELCEWGPGVKNGFYCRPHAAAVEALVEHDDLERIEQVH